MLKRLTTTLATLACLWIAPQAMAEDMATEAVQTKAEVGQPAPDFTVTDVDGAEFKLSDLKGETVVLEWTNHQCPYVIKHYDTKNMQTTQREAGKHGVKWVSIVSSAPERQGHTTAEEAKKIIEEAGAIITTKILDESGEIGQLYGAKTTPHMFIVNPEGILVYAGAIDSNPSPRKSTVKDAENYVLAALHSLQAGEPIANPVTSPYGCSVKYAY